MSMSFKADPSGTFGEILVNGQVVAKLPVSGNAVIPNLVGTVSQSGGIPTGAIIERGSNANGEYIRFADGTQICYTAVVTGQAVTANLYNNSNAIPFPAAFSNTPRVYVQRNGYPHNAGTYSLLSVEAISTTVWYLIVVSNGSFNYDNVVFAIAIGRWY